MWRPARTFLAFLLPALLTVGNVDAVAHDSRGNPRGELEQLYDRGQDHLYNLDYEEALSVFEEAIEVAPDHPGPYSWKATALWMREMFRRGEFDLEGYLDVSRFEGGDGDDQEQAELTRRLFELVDRGLQRARAWTGHPDRELEGKYYQGILLGIRAGYRTLVLRDFLDAIGDSKRSVALHREVVERDPSFVDSYYSLGTFNYVAGKLPWYVKILSFFVGIRGDAEKGIRQLERVAREGDRLRDAARVTLTVIHVREGRPEESAELLAGLGERYPRNFLVAQNRAFALGRAGEWEKALVVYRSLIEKVVAGVPNFDRADPLRLHLEWGHGALQAGEAATGRRAYGWVLQRSDAPGWARTLAHLGRGQTHDLAGERQAAVRDYRAVLEGPDVQGAHDRAEKYLDEPYRGAEPGPRD